MSKTAFRIIGGVKYVYLIVFFTLLSGLFYPIINNTSFDNTVLGVFALLVGLVGGLSLYKAATSENNKTIFMGIGFGLMAISLYSIFYLTGRV